MQRILVLFVVLMFGSVVGMEWAVFSFRAWINANDVLQRMNPNIAMPSEEERTHRAEYCTVNYTVATDCSLVDGNKADKWFCKTWGFGSQDCLVVGTGRCDFDFHTSEFRDAQPVHVSGYLSSVYLSQYKQYGSTDIRTDQKYGAGMLLALEPEQTLDAFDFLGQRVGRITVSNTPVGHTDRRNIIYYDIICNGNPKHMEELAHTQELRAYYNENKNKKKMSSNRQRDL